MLISSAVVFVGAVVCSSSGQAGGSAYLAVMILLGMAPSVMKPSALVLNIIVSSVSAISFCRRRVFAWHTYWPLAIGSIPASFLASRFELPRLVWNILVGLILFYAAARMFLWFGFRIRKSRGISGAFPIALLFGAGIGAISGFTGVGGGIFLGPFLVLMQRTNDKKVSGLSATLILVNSVAALLGSISTELQFPDHMIYWAPAALVGSWIGTDVSEPKATMAILARMLSIILVLGGFKAIAKGVFSR